ncbi:hypothetical protein P170DRAFT_425531 [Aspergillus steynii IBT 23096]|uniref:Uncharacterized protein n=1 Tax=Aspergillus steynii IBT 23096 TaxID=1392250 RepID=A0A2I2GEH2_9EURO|nr:uncharacterized protein P170DRAFT_425531 [Aspergillus steynii IBT 23096]PLB51289.1 hypothetical protein P170DRAFT_425531 [Aspergillus steynii IBT 23096]
MADFDDTDGPLTDPLPILAELGRLLDENRIPNVVGWNWNCYLFGAAGASESVQFVVPDEHVPGAIAVIANAGLGLTPCTDGTCFHVQHNSRAPIPEKHFYDGIEDGVRVSVLRKSATYWALPDLPTQAPAADDRNFMLSNDPRIPPGAARATTVSPFKILTQIALVESLILLACRDARQMNQHYVYWEAYLLSIHMCDPKYRWPGPEALEPQFGRCWQIFCNPPKSWPRRAMQQAFVDLRDELRAGPGLPSPPTINAFGSEEKAEEFLRLNGSF